MQKTLLSTKLHAPPPRQSLVPRPGLMATFAQASAYRLTLVCAPPGYGKTTLVSNWLSGTELPSIWLSLDEGDNDPIRFLEYFLTALHQVVPAIRLDALDLLQSSKPAPFEAVMSLLINAAADAGDFFVVLDDFHVLSAQSILDMLAFLIERMPPAMHMVMLSRTDPPLPLARLRARGHLLEIRAEQLRFTTEETARFFNDILGLNLSDPEISAIETRTEGWIAGLQLAGLAMQSSLTSTNRILPGSDFHSFITVFTGSHTYIMDYLTEEVLRCQPEPVRSFLLRTSILERLCGPLCEAVAQAGSAQPINGQAMLETIEQNHLFVIPLDTERRWYRYHHLFKEVLTHRLESLYPERVHELHHCALEWYEQHGFIHEAIQHAMKAGDPGCTARLVEQYGCALLMAGEVVTLAGWLEAVEPYTLDRPWLAMQKAWVLTLTGQLERAEQAIDKGEQLLSILEPTDEEKTLRGSFAAARAHWANIQGKTDLAAEYAQHALNVLPDTSDFSCVLRSVATSLLGDASWIQGKMQEARLAYTDAARISQAAGNSHMMMLFSTDLADVYFEQGQLHQAARLYTETLHFAEQVDGPDSAYAQSIYLGLAKVFYTWNRLEEAARWIEQGSRLSRQWQNLNLQAVFLALTAQIQIARGNIEKAQEAVAAAEQQIGEHPLSPSWLMRVESMLARLWLSQGRMDKSLLVIKKTGIHPDPLLTDALSLATVPLDQPIPYQIEPAYLILARLFLAKDNPDAALALCDRLLEGARAGERTRMVIELLILQGLAFYTKKDLSHALEALDRAITLAWPEQARRAFLDEGEGMAKLLYHAKARHAGGEFVEELLSMMEQLESMEPPSPQNLQEMLVEPLSARELEVLRCIAEGCSNQEIADRFFLSPKTVKRHISNIYAKLDAKNRTQAVSLARSLKLIE